MQANPYLQPIDDGLPMRDSGPWVAEKLDYLRRYIDVFETSMQKKWPARAYVDLFSGPGKCVDRGTGTVYLGSPLVALTARHPFTDYYFVDDNPQALEALNRRKDVSPWASRVHLVSGDANEVVPLIADTLRTGASLNLAFLDPDGLELAWKSVATLASVPKLDLIIHYPQMGLSRSMPAAAIQTVETQVDRFFGDQEWRHVYNAHRRGEESFLHRRLMDHYKTRLTQLGYAEAVRDDEVGLEPAMDNEKGVHLYRLLFASKHPLGVDFWRKITSKDVRGQRRLPFETPQ